MKGNQYNLRRSRVEHIHQSAPVAAAIALGVAVLQSAANAQVPFQWTNAAQTGDWELQLNWLPAVEPNSDQADVQIANSSPCRLSSQVTVRSLSVSSSGNLTLNAGAVLNFPSAPSTLTNDGVITVNGSGENQPTSLTYYDDMTLGGSGQIILNGDNGRDFAGDGEIYIAAGTTTHAAGHAINGKGDIRLQDSGSLVNNGSIGATVQSHTLVMQLDGGTVTNNGYLVAIGGSTLAFPSVGLVDQTNGGRIYASGAGSTVWLSNTGGTGPTFRGGKLQTFGGGLIRANGATIDGSTNEGQIAGGLKIAAGGVVNNGTIVGSLAFTDTATLSGDGELLLTGSVAAPVRSDPTTITHGPQHLIHGKGTIDLYSAAFANHGTIRADDSSGTLRITGYKGIQNDGALQAAAGGTFVFANAIDQSGGGSVSADGAGSRVLLGGGGAPVLAGGTYNTSSGGLIISEGVTLQDATNSGEIDTDAANGSSGLHVTGNGLANNGTIHVTSSIGFAENTALAGNGQVILVGGAFNAGNSLTIASSQTISGYGVFDATSSGSVRNYGTIAPTGKLQFAGSIQLGSTSNLVFRIGGTIAESNYGVIDKNDNVGLLGFMATPVPFALNGRLTVTLAAGFIPSSSDTFTIITSSASQLQGTFTNVAQQGRLQLADGTGSFLVTYSASAVTLSDYQPATASTPQVTAQSQNISTRLNVLTDDNVMIGGFIVTGTTPKKVIVRAIGPSTGIAGALNDPTLELHLPDGSVVTNDDWKISDATGQPQESDIRATGVPPSDDREAAIVETLNPGSYTAIVRGKAAATGIGLVEVYDIGEAGSTLANISTRGFVDTGDNVMIGGFIIGPSDSMPSKIAVRAIGPSTAVTGALQDPVLELHDGNGALMAQNDNWHDDPSASEIASNQLAPTDPRESAMIRTLNPGKYTVIVRGANSATGVGLVEIYNLR